MSLNENQRNHIGNALLFMCRYSYPRQTSADMACNSALKALWEFVPDNHKSKIIDEIKCEKDFVPDSHKQFSLWEDFLKWEKES